MNLPTAPSTRHAGVDDLTSGRVRKGILILGTHRSGTSLLAELLLKWGVYGRKEDTGKSDIWNPRGYWEYAPLVRMNQRLLKSLNARWDTPPPFERETLIEALARDPQYRLEAHTLIAPFQKQQDPWYWKDPRLCILMPFWSSFLEQTVFVISVRNPLEVANSTCRRNRLSLQRGLDLWEHYMRAALRHSVEPRLFVNYSALLEEPVEQCERLVAFLAAASAVPTKAAKAVDMADIIDGDLCRSRQGMGACEILSPEQKRLYNYLIDRCRE
jgi:hypothetical protein